MPCSNPVREKKRLDAVHTLRLNPVPGTKKPPDKYHPSNHQTPFFKIV
ncbi:MAG TPA: hypothetical protein VHP36_00510 [Chitinispirillaceae bacterium]|nr:hypothetical protein [Chitinispirillaceae bacterium]